MNGKTEQRTYIAIDLKSFFASVECVERGKDPLTTHLVVADESRTEKTICLAVSPSLKAYGIPGRARLFEVIQKIQYLNAQRKKNAPNGSFSGKSFSAEQLKAHPEYEISYITATPRMSYYIDYSTRIYNVYLKYIAPEDIHVYSIDEVFIDATNYLSSYKCSPRELAMTMIRDVLKETGITATAGIGTNLYLCKIAMDIVAKHIEPDQHGVRIAELDEMSYRRQLWNHQPLTDFWRLGRGIAKKLEPYGIRTMGEIARCSIEHEEVLYKLFGINAELIIDHAWGWEPCTIEMIKAYKPENNSLSSGQVLHTPYNFPKTQVVIQEMADSLSLDLVEKKLVCDQLAITVIYDAENLTDPTISAKYHGETTTDFYGRQIPKNSQGSINLPKQTSSSKIITEAAMSLFERITNKELLIRKLNIAALHVVPENTANTIQQKQQLDLFTDYEALAKNDELEKEELEKEHNMQKTILSIKKKFGKNAILKGLNFQDGATAKERNEQIGGHKA
ncbi:MAG: DNA methylase [Bacteroidales bacterium]|nr:DNA methylase [Bacteroidales bacterium]